MRLQQRLTEASEESRQHAAADSEARAQLAGAQLRLLELRTELEDRARAFSADLQQASRAEPSRAEPSRAEPSRVRPKGLPSGPRMGCALRPGTLA